MLLFWWSIEKTRLRLLLLTVGSFIFYGYWDWRFTFLMLFSSMIDYVAGRQIFAARDRLVVRRFWFVAAMCANLSLLGFFKYYDFAVRSLNSLSVMSGGEPLLSLMNIILPVGISFYTFQSMSYTIDIYRGEIDPVDDFLTFACFVSMFPQLVAGPIVRFSEIEAQLRSIPKRLDRDYAKLGLYFFACGLVKKIFFADMVAEKIDPLLAQYWNLGFFGSWSAMLGYAFQIYFDFSGYSDMAVGLGYMLGFRFPMNFNSPYKAENISDFWNRWHITLSHWLRDYLYIPLGGNRHGRLATLRNLSITMFLGGLWHGAAWTFVIWGLYHGLLLICHNLMRAAGLTSRSRAFNRVFTFVCVLVGWVFFRSVSFGMAWQVLKSMTGLNGFEPLDLVRHQLGLRLIAMLGFMLVWVWRAPNTWEIEFKKIRIPAFIPALALVLCVLWLDKESPFLYFQF
ncbi:MBOAT family protein [bacterium]|nr:MBOAT family protein [bacterium]